jgi:hypothetical protein
MNLVPPTTLTYQHAASSNCLSFCPPFFQDVRKKGNASKLISINNNLDDRQKEAIKRVGFGGLLNIKCISVP